MFRLTKEQENMLTIVYNNYLHNKATTGRDIPNNGPDALKIAYSLKGLRLISVTSASTLNTPEHIVGILIEPSGIEYMEQRQGH